MIKKTGSKPAVPQQCTLLGRKRLMSRSLVMVAMVLSGVAAAAPCAELPVLFVVQDKSGSMRYGPDGNAASANNPSKWSSAQSVVPAIAAQYNHRFRFGAMMFPEATTQFNCSTGTVTAQVSENDTAIAATYSSSTFGGGTSTAASLNQAKSYLLGLRLTTRAYVLLITDGLPNCNETLNVNTCSFTTPNCPNNSCGLGAKDCLDDQNTIAAAAALKAANILTYVVGFDSTLTSGNNLWVLNAVAAAGGTTEAYTASNRAQLEAALNAIAVDNASCCKDACTAGAKQCGADGKAQTCTLDPAIGCTVWKATACAASQTCVNGTCTNTCTDACTEGAKRCTEQTIETCGKAQTGCMAWLEGTTCDTGRAQSCVAGECVCTNECVEGAKRCSESGPQTCAKSPVCPVWTNATACDALSVCLSGNCISRCKGEFSECPMGTVCTDVPEGKLCLPGTAQPYDAGQGPVVRPDAGTPKRVDAGVPAGKDISAGVGCGCTSADTGLTALLMAAALVWVSRRRRA